MLSPGLASDPAEDPAGQVNEIILFLESVSPLHDGSSEHQTPTCLRDFHAIILGSLDPKLDGVLGIFDGRLPSRTMSHAARKLWHVHYVSTVFCAPPNNHFVAVWLHNNLEFTRILRICRT